MPALAGSSFTSIDTVGMPESDRGGVGTVHVGNGSTDASAKMGSGCGEGCGVGHRKPDVGAVACEVELAHCPRARML